MRVAVQLGSFRSLSDPVPDLLDRVADAGYDGVGFTGLDEKRLKTVAAALNRTGLSPVAASVPLDRLGADRERVVRELRTIGCERAVVPPMHEAHFETESSVARMATRLSALGGRVAADGRQLCYRNGTHEFEPVGGSDGFDLLAARSGEGVAFEFDAGAVVAAERDPAALLERLSGRVPLVRLRDVDTSGDPAPLGDGVVDLARVARSAANAGAAWLVHEPRDPSHPDESLTRGADVLSSLLD